MDNNTSYCYCDECNRPIDKLPVFEHRGINLCPECATKLYQKIFGNQEDEQ